jgi:hypothetical protein
VSAAEIWVEDARLEACHQSNHWRRGIAWRTAMGVVGHEDARLGKRRKRRTMASSVAASPSKSLAPKILKGAGKQGERDCIREAPVSSGTQGPAFWLAHVSPVDMNSSSNILIFSIKNCS